MATPINSIIWSDLRASINNNIFAKLGIYIEDRSASLNDGRRDTVLDVSIWFQANKAFTQESGHILTINGQQKEVLPIQIKENEATIIYFETMTFDKALLGYLNENGQEVSDIVINVVLSNMNNFIEDFTVAKEEHPVILTSYSVTFIQKFSETNTVSLNTSAVKYHSIIKGEDIIHPFYLYKVDFEDYMFVTNNNIRYKLILIENDIYKYDLQNRRSDVITTNNDLSFYLVYEEIKYKNIYNGNGGKTETEKTEVELNKDEVAPNFTKTGYNFLGWSYSPSMYGKSIDISDVPKDEDILLYAKWEPIEVAIRYVLDSDATNRPENKIFKYNEVTMISDKIPQLDKYVFLRWKGNDNNYYHPNEIISLTKELELTAEWEELEYTVQYILPNGEKQISKFTKDNGFVKEVKNAEGAYQYFSYGIDDNMPDKQINDKLENRNHTLYAMVYNQVNIIYSYGIDRTYTETKNVYNHGNVLQKYKPRQSMLYIINNADGEKQYFQYWTDESGYIYSPNLYYNLPLILDDNGNAQDIIFTAVYGDDEYIEHNVFITKDNGISLVAEDFNEDDSLMKSEYSIAVDDVKQDVEGFIFFKQGEVTAKKFNETDRQVDYNIGSKETGIFNFNNYIQETKLKKQLLQISLKELDGDNLGYVVLDDFDVEDEDSLDVANNDIYISL